MKLDFSKIAYNIEDIPEHEDVLDRFSDLALQSHVFGRSDDLPDGVSADKVLRYIIYMFSPGTPVTSAFADIDKRKKYVLFKLNIDLEEMPYYAGMCLMNEPWAVDRYIAFMQMQCSEDFGVFSSALIMMTNIQREMLVTKFDKTTDFKNLQGGLESWRDTAVSARERLMHDESSLVLQKAITFSATASGLGIQPEEYTRVWRDKKEIFPDVVP